MTRRLASHYVDFVDGCGGQLASMRLFGCDDAEACRCARRLAKLIERLAPDAAAVEVKRRGCCGEPIASMPVVVQSPRAEDDT